MPLCDTHNDHHNIFRTWRTGLIPFLFIVLSLLLNALTTSRAYAQQQEPVITYREPSDETQQEEPEEKRFYDPTRASMLSAALPGMGQIYNGRYWKVPIIYVGFGAVAYFVNFNNNEYQFLRNAYLAKVDGNPNTIDEFEGIPAANLQRGMNYYRRNLEISYIAGAVLYLLNILDASVDAHLLDFDVGEDLTMRMHPQITPMPPSQGMASATGLKLTIRF
ncbi:MAG: DUF5683 domain-containing protein [Bacteroidales bacterium]